MFASYKGISCFSRWLPNVSVLWRVSEPQGNDILSINATLGAPEAEQLQVAPERVVLQTLRICLLVDQVCPIGTANVDGIGNSLCSAMLVHLDQTEKVRKFMALLLV